MIMGTGPYELLVNCGGRAQALEKGLGCGGGLGLGLGPRGGVAGGGGIVTAGAVGEGAKRKKFLRKKEQENVKRWASLYLLFIREGKRGLEQLGRRKSLFFFSFSFLQFRS